MFSQIPGVGYITASAIIAAVADASVFKNGREFAAWLGLIPREHYGGEISCRSEEGNGTKFIIQLPV